MIHTDVQTLIKMLMQVICMTWNRSGSDKTLHPKKGDKQAQVAGDVATCNYHPRPGPRPAKINQVYRKSTRFHQKSTRFTENPSGFTKINQKRGGYRL